MDNKYYEPFEIIKFEKISDDVVHIGRNYIIKINANLAKTVNDKRYLFYKEFEYTINGHARTSIKRGFDYYLSIESLTKNANGDRAFVRIGVTEYYSFMKAIMDVMNWFTDKKYANVFAKKNNELILTANRPATRYVYGLPQNKFLSFELIVLEGYITQPGVRITVGSEDMYTDVPADAIFGIYGALVNFNMFMSAQTMVSSLGIPLGTNRINLNDSNKNNSLPTESEKVSIQKTSSIEGRRIGGITSITDLEGD